MLSVFLELDYALRKKCCVTLFQALGQASCYQPQLFEMRTRLRHRRWNLVFSPRPAARIRLGSKPDTESPRATFQLGLSAESKRKVGKEQPGREKGEVYGIKPLAALYHPSTSSIDTN